MKKYNNRMITSAEDIGELLNLSKNIVTYVKEGQEKDLSTKKYAFYEILAADHNALEEMQYATLIAKAYELDNM